MSFPELDGATYLGDAVYVNHDSQRCLWLYTSNGVQLTNAICLEDFVLVVFIEWLTQKRGDLPWDRLAFKRS